MKCWNAWLYGLGLSGVLIFGLSGCGGGDVPDPSADDFAAMEEGGGGPLEPSFPAPAAAAPGPAGPGPSAEALAPTPDAAAPPEVEASAAAPASAPAANVKSETADMLSLATGAAAAPSAQPEPAAANRPGGLGEPGVGEFMPAPGGPAFGGRMGEADAPGFAGPGAMGAFGPAGPGTDSARGGFLDPGGADSKDAGDTNSPEGAVKAFLHALKARDRDRLADATALRADSDEGGKHREMFSHIIDSSIGESELDDLATLLEGYTVGGQNQVKSTGQRGVTIRKNLEGGNWLQRTVTVRREKKGWGVLDITSPPTKFNAMRGRGTGRR